MNTRKMVLSALVAGAVVLGSNTAFAKDGKVKCVGGNSCKGKTACAGAHGSCKGGNACKGEGWVYAKSDKACAKMKSKMKKHMKKSKKHDDDEHHDDAMDG